MKCLLILSVLLIGMRGILGHSIMKLGIQNDTSGDVYEIKEDKEKNTIAFVNPKVEKPTLREIVYYHMIERPYGQEGRETYKSEEGPDFDETMRPFTNSHGFPFLESVEKESDVTIDTNKGDFTEVNDAIADETSLGDDDVEVIYYYDEDEAFDVNKKPNESEETEIYTTHAPEEFDALETSVLRKISDDKKEKMTTQAVPVKEVTTVTAEPVFERKAKSTRKLLFDRVKEKYYSKPNEAQSSTPSDRRKRELIEDDIPEAPILAELNYGSLPPYLRNMLSLEPQTRKASIIPESDEESMLDDIIHSMEKIMAKLKTDSSEDTPRASVKPRTYGMNLTADSGYVWNDLLKPSIHYNVEAAESIEQTIPDDRSEEIEDMKHEIEDIKHEKEEDKDRIPEDAEEEKEVKEETKEDDNVSNEEMGKKRHNDAEDIIDQLMENKKFWNWLAEWTSVYMEVLMEHINVATKAVEEKVKKQVEKQIKELKKEMKKLLEEDHFKGNDSNKTGTKDKNHSLETKDSDKKIDNVKEKEKNESSVVKSKDETKKEEESNNNKEIEEKNKPKHGVSNIETKNVYGSTVGEKVTNIFIFYPNEDADKVLKDVSKLNDSQDLNVDIKLNVNKNKDDNAKKDESTQEKKDAIDVTTKRPEKDISSTTEAPKDNEEKAPTNAASTTTEATTVSSTKRPDEETTKNKVTTESIKAETTEHPAKDGKDGVEKSKNEDLNKENREETSAKVDTEEKQETNKKEDNSTGSKTN